MEKVRLSRSIVGEEEAKALARVILDDGYLGMGQEVQRFERELAEFLGVPAQNVACGNSGTAALQLAVEAALAPGDEVLVQSLTFVASFQAIRAAGMVPVACEALRDTVTIDLQDAATRLTSRTKAIMPVHYASNPAGLDAVYDFAGRHGLRVIEDAAHAFGCSHQGRKVGSFGDIQCFSFDGIKNITCGEGGAVVSADRAVMARVRDARLLGVERDTDQRFSGQRSWDFDVKRTGYRYHMSNLNAAIGRVQLRRFPGEFAPKRTQLARRYRQRLEGLPGLALLSTDLGEVIPHLQPVRVLHGRRDALRAYLQAQGVETGIHYKPNHLLSLFRGDSPRLPVTEQLYEELLSLPLHPGLELATIDRIADLIGDFAKQPKT
ncbi:MAG TPA: DegT/DnrJ/EryC1/StrS aminotransferase family protein [Lacunisphaera sp.]|nr:DegT/DnrJ/EryC1/StrS aminotransferase family protein [Lacunisphaera sp.]